MGTAEYLAPEQALDAAAAQIQADIYSLGCTLYHLLTGHPPFTGGSVMSILLRHKDECAAARVEWRPDVPAELSALIDWMLAKNAADRPQTPKEVAAALASTQGADGGAGGTDRNGAAEGPESAGRNRRSADGNCGQAAGAAA